jgi:hypothetical protein
MSYIRTQENNIFDYLNIKNNQVSIEEIASVLSKIPRWLGHTDEFYSVAQHCCWCYDNTEGNKLEALMHDAPEAYVGDCPTPLKKLLPEFRKIEDEISKLLSKTFNYNYPYSEETHDVDSFALAFERHNIKYLDNNYVPLEVKPINNVEFWSCKKGKNEFLKRFYNEQ